MNKPTIQSPVAVSETMPQHSRGGQPIDADAINGDMAAVRQGGCKSPVNPSASLPEIPIDRQDHPQPPADLIAACAEASESVTGTNSRKNVVLPYETIGMFAAATKSLPPMEYIWGSMPYSDSPTIVVYGPPGRGKTRFVQCLATAQILGRPFLGLPTLQRPLTWLHIQTENGIHRQQAEARRFLFGDARLDDAEHSLDLDQKLAARGLTRTDVEKLEKYNIGFALQNPEDRYISIGDDENRQRIIKTLEDVQPNVNTWDPWGDVVIEGAELDDSKIRETVRTIIQCEVAARLDPLPVNIILAHSRMGIAEEARAAGGDAGNYGKNSKAIYSIARYVLNIRAASLEDNPPIEIICAKNNDGEKSPPIAARLNFAIREYEQIEDFDHEQWQRDIEAAAGIKSSSGHKKADAGFTAEGRMALARKSAELVKAHERVCGKTDLTNEVYTTFKDSDGVSHDTAKAIVETLIGNNTDGKGLREELGIVHFHRIWPKADYIGTPEQMERFRAEEAEAEAKKAAKKTRKR